MLEFDRILFPTDFSDTARRALPLAAHLAVQHGATLHILHVRLSDAPMEPPSKAQDVPSTQSDLTEYSQRTAMELGLTTWKGSHEPDLVRTRRTAGTVREAVVGYAEDEAVDLVAMGAARQETGRTVFTRSVPAEVVRHGPCPVLTVPDLPASAPAPIDQIFVPYDFSTYANRSVRYAEVWAELYEAEVTLVHVIEELMVPSEYGVDVPSLDVRSVRSRAKAALQGVSDKDHRVLVASGHPAERLVKIAEEQAANLIVMATHGRTGLRRMLLGSVAEQVLHATPCPILTLRAFPSSGDDQSSD